MVKKYTINDLKNNQFSLVLSGGSALGFAHLGVFKFLEENNLKPCEIIGTSFGALAGALYAQGYTYDELYNITTHFELRKLISIKYGQSGLKQDKLYNYLKILYKKETLSQTKILLKLVATNFMTGNSYAFTKKDNIKIVDGVMASISVPGVFSPKKINHEYYVDGFLSSNLPIDYANKNKLILAIDVNNPSTIIDFRKRKKRLFRKTKEIMETLSNTFNWMIVNQTRDKLQELDKQKVNYIFIEPNLLKFKKSDFKKGEQISKQGYSAIHNYFN